MLKLMGKKILTFYAQKVCLSKPVTLLPCLQCMWILILMHAYCVKSFIILYSQGSGETVGSHLGLS